MLLNNVSVISAAAAAAAAAAVLICISNDSSSTIIVLVSIYCTVVYSRPYTVPDVPYIQYSTVPTVQ
jgi:hypothetical protein